MKTVRLTKDSQRDLLDSLLKRSPNNYGQYESVVADIIANVREKGDEAVFDYTSQFDKWNCNADNIRVTDAEIEKAYAEADAAFVAVMEKSAANIRDFHQKQLRNSWIDTRPDGSILGQRILPIAVSGVYVPGGKAAYPSSVLMNVIPAKVAGVERIVMTTPAGADGKVNPALWLPQRLQVLMKFIRWAARRQSPRWLLARKAFRKWTRSRDPAIFLWRWQRRHVSAMSALTPSRDRVRSL